MQHTGNPTIPGYTADATVWYDTATGLFLIYGTNDGNFVDNVWPPQVFYSDDFCNWRRQSLELPEAWFPVDHLWVWAPSIARRQGWYFITYSIHGTTRIAMSSSPLGPFREACGYGENEPLLQKEQIWGDGGDAYDARLFADEDGAYYLTFGGNHQCAVCRLAFDAAGRVTVDNTDPRMTETAVGARKIRYQTIMRQDRFMEASCMFRRENRYYLLWSTEGCANYKVYYAMADNPAGPFHMPEESLLISREDERGILGPGHQSVFSYGGAFYLAYHRQHVPYIDSKRQTCADRLAFDSAGRILPLHPSHEGAGLTVRESRADRAADCFRRPSVRDEAGRPDLVLGKPALASSCRAYIPMEEWPHPYTYEAACAVDGSFATRWEPAAGDEAPWLLVDLGREAVVTEISLLFEFVSKYYHFRLELLPASCAENLEDAKTAAGWKPYGPETCVMDTPAKVLGRLSGRYIRFTFLGAEDLPAASSLSDPENARNGLSLVSLSAYEAGKI